MSRMVTVTDNPDRLKGEISFEERAKQLEAEADKQKKKIRGSAYREFAQLNMEGKINEIVMNSLFDCPPAGKIFFFIANHMDGYNALIASYKVFEEALDLSKPTIARGIKFLKDKGYIYILKSGSANVYTINPKIIWKSWGKNIKYCEFPANIIISKAEQEADTAKIKEHFKKVMNIKQEESES